MQQGHFGLGLPTPERRETSPPVQGPLLAVPFLELSPGAWGGEVSRGVRHMPNRTVPSPAPGATKH